MWKIVVSGLFDEGESEEALEEDGRTKNMSKERAKAWVDLAEECKSYVEAMPSPEKSCWMCKHFWNWESTRWYCEFVDKERKRKFLMVGHYKGQKKLLEVLGV